MIYQVKVLWPMRGICLPPLGVFVRDRNDRSLVHHEMAHWAQYLNSGSVGAFYWAYLRGWVKAGFSYRRNWMEVEARDIAAVWLFLES